MKFINKQTLLVTMWSGFVLASSGCSIISDEEIATVETNKLITVERPAKPVLIKNISVVVPNNEHFVEVKLENYNRIILILEMLIAQSDKENTEASLLLSELKASSYVYKNVVITSINSYENISKNLLELLRYKRETESVIEFYEQQVFDNNEKK